MDLCGYTNAQHAFPVFLGNGVNTLLIEWQLDNDFTRFALCALIPLLFAVSLFFCTFVLLQPPSAAIGRALGAKHWIPTMTVSAYSGSASENPDISAC